MHKSTKAHAIPLSVKKEVAKRDSFEDWPCCLLCGLPAPSSSPWAFSCAHYIPRSQGGLGVPENILTLCPDCHRRYDQSTARSRMKEFFREYLMSKYPDWDEDKLIYKKE